MLLLDATAPTNSMGSFITALTGENGISASTLWSQLTNAAPFIIIIFIFAFGYRIIKKALKSGSKGKVGL